METKKKIGKRIADARKKLGFSKMMLSEKSGFGVSRLGNWEAGIRTPKPVDVKVLEQILGISSAFLLGLVDNEDGYNHSELKNTFKSLPLFNISDLLHLSYNNPISTIEATESLPLPQFCEHLLIKTPFAIRMSDNSMSPAFEKENILVFIPDVEAKHNDIVLATLPGLKTPMIRKHYIDSSNIDDIIFKFIPLHPEWVTNNIKDTDTASITIHGVLSKFETVFF
jgi:transcriptional regulator with XRE-family HTH domain